MSDDGKTMSPEPPPETERARAVRVARDRIEAERTARPAWESFPAPHSDGEFEASGPAGSGWAVVLTRHPGCGQPGCTCGGGIAWAVVHAPSGDAVCFLRSPLIAALAADALAAFAPSPGPTLSPDGIERAGVVGSMVEALEGSPQWYTASIGVLREMMNGRRPMLVLDPGGGRYEATKAAMNEDGAIEVDGDREGET